MNSYWYAIFDKISSMQKFDFGFMQDWIRMAVNLGAVLTVWYKTKFGSQNLVTTFGVFLYARL